MLPRSSQILGSVLRNTYQPSHTLAPVLSSQLSRFAIRPFSSTKMASFPTPSSDRPKHEMQYFPNMLTALPAESADFRRVMWTGECLLKSSLTHTHTHTHMLRCLRLI
ncbi:hypothetical protein F4779DRAFT_442293 [Xylariaceae sp. FL0662B]|nr:hypothetical protein F4779DRAFT_442293 [Xylariaceae sp. FL0662B]